MTRSLLVTGGATGLGAAVAVAAVRAGYRVGVIDLDPPGFEAHGSAPVRSYLASVTEAADIETVLDDFGPVDVLVNNAGIVRFGPLLDLAIDDWRSVVEVNLTGAFVVARAVARRMAGRGGAIVNVTSMNGVAPGPNAGAYGATKAGLALLTQQMAIEWAPLGIRVNAVAPGLIDAGMSAPLYEDGDTRRARESKVPLGRLGTADDVARAVLWLASDDAGYIAGQNLLVDGGVTMSLIAHLPRPAAVDGVGAERPSPGREEQGGP